MTTTTLDSFGPYGARINRKLPVTALLRSGSLVGAAAGRAFVLLDMFGSGWGDLNTLSMEPFLADVTADPEFIGCVVLSTSTTKGLTMLVIFIFFFFFIF